MAEYLQDWGVDLPKPSVPKVNGARRSIQLVNNSGDTAMGFITP